MPRTTWTRRFPAAPPPWGPPAPHGPRPPQDVTSDYHLGKVLGRGQFGTTRVAEPKAKKGVTYACKSIAKRKLT